MGDIEEGDMWHGGRMVSAVHEFVSSGLVSTDDFFVEIRKARIDMKRVLLDRVNNRTWVKLVVCVGVMSTILVLVGLVLTNGVENASWIVLSGWVVFMVVGIAGGWRILHWLHLIWWETDESILNATFLSIKGVELFDGGTDVGDWISLWEESGEFDWLPYDKRCELARFYLSRKRRIFMAMWDVFSNIHGVYEDLYSVAAKRVVSVAEERIHDKVVFDDENCVGQYGLPAFVTYVKVLEWAGTLNGVSEAMVEQIKEEVSGLRDIIAEKEREIAALRLLIGMSLQKLSIIGR